MTFLTEKKFHKGLTEQQQQQQQTIYFVQTIVYDFLWSFQTVFNVWAFFVMKCIEKVWNPILFEIQFFAFFLT